MKPYFHARDFTETQQPSVDWNVNSMEWDVNGGPRVAVLTPTGDDNAIWSLAGMLRCPVTIYDDLGRAPWYGYVSEVHLASQGGVVGVGFSLDNMANNVACTYSRLIQGQDDPGERVTTEYSAYAFGTATYGQKDYVCSADGASDAGGTAIRDAYLSRHQVPPGVAEVGGMGVSVVCRGWYDTLDWRLASWPTLAAISYPEAAGTVNTTFGTAATNERLAQQFTCGSAIDITSVQVYLKAVGTPTDNVVLSVYANDVQGTAGTATGSPLLTASIAGTSIGTSSNVFTSFTYSGNSLSGGNTMYSLVLERSGANNGTNYYVTQTNTNAGYSGGVFKTYNSAGTVWTAGTVDMHFTINVDSWIDSVQQIDDLTSRYGQFLGVRIYESGAQSGQRTSSYRDGDASALVEIDKLRSMGGSNGRRILVKVDEARRVVFYEEQAQPAENTALFYMDKNGKIFISSGAEIEPHMVWMAIGKYIQLRDVVGATADTTLLLSPAMQFLEGAVWNEGVITPEFRGDVNVRDIVRAKE